jgi:2-oxoglutarate ferredoxin oxidoreductase subunit gamma
MQIKTIFAGFGGQGVLMMGYSFAQAAMFEGFHVTYLPSYGVEVRGGTANCTVSVSNEEIASPVASQPDYLVVMNNPSLLTFQTRIAPGGAFFLNSSIITGRPNRSDVDIWEIPTAEIATELGNPRVQNVVMMGAYVKMTRMVSAETYLKSLKSILGAKKKAAMEINRKAFEAGFNYIE